ncbi:MAG: thioredoxin domain-containing protein [Candidatus Sungbacteria bacterium]|uniref:Thioredoxin domain-containing protein n=1 Tax=Candidatus Sungiibacteriota bacterium TaxID=2750080 RepID=A0A932VR06_9BACT|nr:thioredoxin domain-containing protein [Candidatus Sungbacteria bacterium]
MPPESKQTQQNLAIPIAIVIAGVIIGGAIFFMEKGKPVTTTSATGTQQVAAKDIPAVTPSDHIFGDPNAPIKIVEYTDLECPFCKQFDATMKQVMQAYPGKVAWVMRNFPLQQLHPNAPKLALAAECVAELGGNDAYWKFKDSIFTQAPINTFFDMTKLTTTAQGVGVDGKKFDLCVASGKYQDKISKDFNDAVAAGGQGTPFSVLITKSGAQVPIPGSQPFDSLKQAIDTALKG